MKCKIYRDVLDSEIFSVYHEYVFNDKPTVSKLFDIHEGFLDDLFDVVDCGMINDLGLGESIEINISAIAPEFHSANHEIERLKQRIKQLEEDHE